MPERSGQKKQFGFDAAEGGVAGILAGFSALYTDKGERQIVETVIFPHFRTQLADVYRKFIEHEEIDHNRPMVPTEIGGFLSAVDKMIGENKVLLDLDGIFKPVAERIQEIRTAISETLKAQFYQHCREILAGHGVMDRQNLLKRGPMWFMRTEFPPYGKGNAFAGRILGRVVVAPIHVADLNEISDVLGFEKLSREAELKKYRDVLAEHEITDRQSLLDKSPSWFTQTNFRPYGKGNDFAGEILGRVVQGIRIAHLEEIADVLGFEKPSREEELQKCCEILAEHGVTDRQSLLSKGTKWFTQTDFPPYGKYAAFAGKILERIIGAPYVADLNKIADVLGFEKLSRDAELKKYCETLVGYGVTDRQSLLNKGPVWFTKADFPPYGGGKAFAKEILGRSAGQHVCIATLNEIANILWPNNSSNES